MWHYAAAVILTGVAFGMLFVASKHLREIGELLRETKQNNEDSTTSLQAARRLQAESQAILDETKEYRRAVMG